jgi:hypothetical protein
MPMKNGVPHCVNHPDVQLTKQQGFNAVTALEKAPAGPPNFKPDTGIPTVVYYCNLCGYMELYAAQKTSFW